MVYYLIGAQLLNKNEDYTWQQIKTQVLAATLGSNAQGKTIRQEKEKFRLGNLDQLMYINDLIIKQEVQVESLLKKIERQYLDIDEQANTNFKITVKEGVFSIEKYLYDFQWDDHRFPRNQVLSNIIKEIQNRVQSIESDIRTKTTQMQESKSQYTQISKKDGNLITRDFVDILKEPIATGKDFVNTSYIQTFILVVQKSQIEILKQNYIFLSENIIPDSLHQFNYEDKDGYTLWSIKLLKIPLNMNQEKNPIEEFVKNMKDKLKIHVREFNFIAGESQKKSIQIIELETKTQSLLTTLKQSCEQSYSDLFVTYMHLKHLRFVIESVMRFGQEKFLASIIQPYQGKEKRIQQGLLKLFDDSSQVGNLWPYLGIYGTKEELEDQEDFFPFIYIPININ